MSSDVRVQRKSGQFSIATQAREGCQLIHVGGELDKVTAPQLEQAIGACTDGLPLIVDLTGLTLVSSVGLRVLFRSRPGGSPAVICPAGDVRRALDMVRRRNGTAVFDSIEAAVERFRMGSSQQIKADPLFGSGSVMARLMGEIDWGRTPLGPSAGWPAVLRSSVAVCLESRFPVIVWWGRDLRMLYNDGYVPMLGAGKHPAALGTVGREVWPEIWDIVGPMLDGVLARGEATWSEDQRLHIVRDGKTEEAYFTFSYSPIRDENGIVVGVFTPVVETTDRVVGSRRLGTMRALGALSAGALPVDDVCQKCVTALADNPDDVPFAVIYEDVANANPRPVAKAGDVPSGLEQAVARTFRSADPRERRWFDVRLDLAEPGVPSTILRLPLGASPGDVTRWLVCGASSLRPLDEEHRTFFDLIAAQIAGLTADAQAAARERARVRALEELDNAKSVFMANVSHEFRTPLTLLLGAVSTLEQDAGLLPTTLPGVRRSVGRLIKLVDSLLEFARSEAGTLEPSFEQLDIAKETAEIASLFRSMFEAAGLTLTIERPTGFLPVRVDREMWEKVVSNLLSNAFKHTFEGGVTLEVRCAAGNAQIVVRDTGVGIPVEELPSVFGRFHQVKGSRSRSHEGAGIGLALARELVELHGGQIEAVSTVDQGTTMTVTLPLTESNDNGEESPLDAAGRVAGPYLDEMAGWAGGSFPQLAAERESGQVYVVDDNADMRFYLARVLSPHWKVEMFADGAEALARITESPPDLVVSDVMMPALDGLGLLQELRSQSATRMLPVLLLSARAGDEAAVEGLGAGADDYLVKPFSEAELIARVRSHVDLRRIREATLRHEQWLAGEQAERNRWARELHDETLQGLAAIQLHLVAAQKSGDNVMLDNVLGLTETEIAKLRSLIAELRPPALDEQDLATALVALAASVNDSGALEAFVAVDLGDQHQPPLPSRVDLTIYRVVQESLRNAVKHARASMVEVNVRRLPTAVDVTVRDDGSGFDTSIPGAGFGLVGMSERSQLVGGILHVASAPGKGTTVTLTVPLSEKTAVDPR